MKSSVENILSVIERRVSPIDLLAIYAELAKLPGDRIFRERIDKFHQRARERWADPMTFALKDRDIILSGRENVSRR